MKTVICCLVTFALTTLGCMMLFIGFPFCEMTGVLWVIVGLCAFALISAWRLPWAD